MRYVSTRGNAPPVSFTNAILAGLAPDGGLYVPESWPQVATSLEARRLLVCGHYASSAAEILRQLSDDLSGETITRVTMQAYGAEAWPVCPTPLVSVEPGHWVLELFHGPSLSFKDVAMQLIARLYDVALAQQGARLSVVCATSGDTGGAAVEALKASTQTDLFVLLPKGRVSDVQRRFMTASGAPHVHALEVDGDFDACQAIVKALFGDRAFSQRAALSGVNSINWARIMAQSVYYHWAAHSLNALGHVDFVVPTGNFGDAYSGWVAKQMGAPIGKILIATNANDILARTLESGRYERARASHATLSPAMDIQVASNFERILFEALDRDGAHVARLYAQFAQSDGFDIPARALDRLREDFAARSISDSETRATISSYWAQGRGYLACPHTAVALQAGARIGDRDGDFGRAPRVTLATAHPAKFPETVEAAAGHRPPLPQRCADLMSRAEQITTMPNDAVAVKKFMMERSRAWRG